MKNFKQLLVWEKGFDIEVNSFKLTSAFPKEERFSLAKLHDLQYQSHLISQKEAAVLVKRSTTAFWKFH